MNRPPLEVADLIRNAGAAFLERNRQWIGWKQVKVLRAIARCRTAALGGHLDQCTRCGYRVTFSYNSCRNRHCPKCQTAARDRWIAARQKELLPTRYVHVVFTLPASLAPLTLQNKKFIYGLLLRASAETLLEVARDPKHLLAALRQGVRRELLAEGRKHLNTRLLQQIPSIGPIRAVLLLALMHRLEERSSFQRRTSETTSSLSVGLRTVLCRFTSGDGFPVLLTLWFEGESPQAR